MKVLKLCVLAFTLWAATTHSAVSQSTKESSDSLKTIKVKVKGITCSMDVKTLSSNVEKLPGVHSCTPGKQRATTTFEVTYNPALVSEKEIYAAIENTGGCENPEDKPYTVKQ